jgi:hypothetical protein
MPTTNECEGRSNRLPHNNQKFMLLFARCDGDRTAQCKDQQHKPRLSTVSTPKKACKHTKDGVYIAKVMYVAKGKYIEYAKDGMYIANSEHSEYAVRHVRCPGRVWRVRRRRTDPHGTMTMSSHATTVLISEADNIVSCNDQTPSLSLSTKSVKLRPQINQIEVD